MELQENNRMNKENEICVVAWYDSVNFGTCLQAYALSKTLKDLGYSSYICSNHKYFYGIKHPIYTMSNIISKLYDTSKKENDSLKVRKEKNHHFAQINNNIFIVNNRRDYYRKINSTYIFITGSDQIWNPSIITPPFLLAMIKARKNVKRIAYGSSIGTNIIPLNKKRMFKKYLSLFHSIGVREHSAVVEIKKLVKHTVQIKQVLDPTFLVDPQIYIDLANHSSEFEYLRNINYIICYFVGNLNIYNENIFQFASEYNCKVINIVGESVEELECATNLFDVGVEDFLWLLINAKYVVSDSFHASVFSLLFQKQFLIFKRFKDDDIHSQNSRIYDLFTMLNISERLVDEYDNLDKLMQCIDYQKINQILGNLIEDSKIFLKNSISK